MSLTAPPSLQADAQQHHELSARRQAAFHRAKQHSRHVSVLKRVLPALSILCVCGYFIQGSFSFHFNDIKGSVKKIEISKNELKMVNPRLEGHDEKSGAYLILADTARQKSSEPHVIQLEAINGKLEHPKNGIIKLVSQTGKFNTRSEILWLHGDIRITGESGMKARLENAKVDIKKQLIVSEEPVFMEMNGSTIYAEKLVIEGGNKVMTFRQNVAVKLIKNPETKTSEGATQ